MILLISCVFPPEPVVSASLAFDLFKALSKIMAVKVLTPKPSRPFGFSFNEAGEKEYEDDHIILNSFTYPKSKILGRMFESYSFGKHASRYISKNRSLIQCIYINTWPLFAQYFIVKTSKKYSIPTVLHIQDIYPESLLDKLPIFKNLIFNLLYPIEKYVQKNATRVVTISPGMKTYLIKTRGLDDRKIAEVFNWQNEEKFIASNNIRRSEDKNACFTFMFLGNLNRTAAIDILISAYQTTSIENSRLIIAGSGSQKDSLISLAASYNGINIEFWDAPMMKVPEIQFNADVLLLNLKKGAARFALPSKLPAYMFSAKPIIACVDEDSDTANAIKIANCGWIVPPEDPEALSKAMVKVSSIPKEDLNKFGRNGFTYASENFSNKINLQKLVTIINNLVNTY